MNTFVYAPKEDPYHRRHWDKPYPAPWIKSFVEWKNYADKQKVSLVPCLAPGLSLECSRAEDLAKLMQKIKQFKNLGVKTVAVLMDDVPLQRRGRDRRAFSSLGEAHGRLMQNLLGKSGTGLRFWFCPTVYAGELATGKEGGSYLEDLAKHLPESVPVFWTGPKVISPALNKSLLKDVTDRFPQGVLLWDNYYAHDYCPDKIFLGAFRDRDLKIKDELKGFFLNPTGLPHTDGFYLHLLAGFLKGEPPHKTWKKAVSHFEWPITARSVVPLLDGPFHTRTLKSHSLLEKSLWHLAFAWDSPFRREWFTALQTLRRDLKLTTSKKKNPETLHKFSPFLQKILSKK